jgi:hypothetical protein
MADLSKLKRRTTLGTPPSPAEASQNLHVPELAAAGEPPAAAPLPAAPLASAPARLQEAMVPQAPPHRRRLDGRSLRKTGRTLQLATRVSWEFDEKLRRIAQRDGLKLVEVLERALEAYEAARKELADR